jgi:hypothetical protein
MNMRERIELQNKPKEIIKDWKVQLAACLVTIGVLIIILAKAGFFKGMEGTGSDLWYILTGPGLFLIGTAGAPIWITCLIYLIYKIVRLIFAIIIAVKNRPSKEELEQALKGTTLKDLVSILSDHKKE